MKYLVIFFIYLLSINISLAQSANTQNYSKAPPVVAPNSTDKKSTTATPSNLPKTKSPTPPMQFDEPNGDGKTPYNKDQLQNIQSEETTITDKVRFSKRVRAMYAIFTVEYVYQKKKVVGQFKVKLYHQRARNTVNNFVALAEGTKEFIDPKTEKKVTKPFYNGLTFHRIVKKFIAQTGDPFGNNKGSGPGYTLPLEISERLVHDRYGVVSMARHKGESHGSQFFIPFGPIPHLNRVNTVFGQVVDGVNILEQIENVKTDREDKPRYPVKIRNIKIERIY